MENKTNEVGYLITAITIILAICKLFNLIDSWWTLLFPITAFVVFVIIVIIGIIITIKFKQLLQHLKNKSKK